MKKFALAGLFLICLGLGFGCTSQGFSQLGGLGKLSDKLAGRP